MRKKDVQIGEVYAVKVSGQIAPVVIDEAHPAGGWVGTNEMTHRQVRIKSAQRLRGLWDHYLAGGDDAAEEPAAAPKPPLVRPEDKAGLDKLAADVLGATGATGGARGESRTRGTGREAQAKKSKKRATRAETGAKGAKMSGLDAAAKVLEEAGEPLNCKAIVERAFETGYWHSDGKTPAATIYAAILREIQKKGDQARFHKVARGRFELAR